MSQRTLQPEGKGEQAPLESQTLKEKSDKQEILAVKGQPQEVEANLLDIPLDYSSTTGNKPRLEENDGRLRVFVPVKATGIDILHPFPDMKPTKLEMKGAIRIPDAGETDAHPPPGAKVNFMPDKALTTNSINNTPVRKVKDSGLDKGATIFDTDDRFLFTPTSYPWNIAGKVRTAGGWGSGCMIGPRHVLTASHVIDWRADGTAGWATFTPAYYDGRGPWGEIASTEFIYWERAPRSLTDQQTAFDYVVLILNQRIGDSIGWAGTRLYNGSWNGGKFWQHLGYPGERSSGERPAFQNDCIISSNVSQTLDGRNAFVLGHFNDFTPGMSGGPAWGWWANEAGPRVVGVGSTIGSTTVEHATGSTLIDNEYGGGQALLDLVSWALANRA